MKEKDFNEKYPVGSPVYFYPIALEDERIETKTRTPAWALGSGHVVVSVEGRSGGVSINHIESRPTPNALDVCPACGGSKEVFEYGQKVDCIACK